MLSKRTLKYWLSLDFVRVLKITYLKYKCNYEKNRKKYITSNQLGKTKGEKIRKNNQPNKTPHWILNKNFKAFLKSTKKDGRNKSKYLNNSSES